MSSAKRRAVTDERPSKKIKFSKDSSDQKKTAKQPKHVKAHDEDDSDRKPLPKSVLQQEERAFPRGGGSVLTPLEHKQIKAEADRDVLYEQEIGRTVRENSTHGDLFQNGASAKQSKKKSKKRGQSDDDAAKSEVSGIRIQGLSYKNISVGTGVLGCVTAITSRDVALALANNLTGYVPLTAISQKLNSRINDLLDHEVDNKASEDDEDIDLKKLLYVGQWVRAMVTSTTSEGTDANNKSKRHIELTLDPQRVNGDLTTDAVVVNSMIQASVRSVEDHGVVMDVGLPEAGVKGFISKKDLGPAYKLDEIQVGRVIMCLVTGKGSDGKLLKLSAEPTPFLAASGSKKIASVSEAPYVQSFQPGTAVDVLVTRSGSGGLAGKVMGMFDVTSDIVHSGAGQSEHLSKKYKVGSKTKGRIVWCIPQDDGSRQIGISLLEHILMLPSPTSKLPENANSKLRTTAGQVEQTLPPSVVLDNVAVTHVLAERGVFLKAPSQQNSEAIDAFAHISQLSDSRVDTITSNAGPYKVGSMHKIRVLSYNPIDKLYYVSLKPSILAQTFLHIEDVKLGELVKGTVEKLILGAKGITGVIVRLSDSITCLVPEMHLSDVQLQHPERKFKEGFPVKGRVLDVDLDKGHIRLTLKKSLMEEKNSAKMWKDYADLQPGMEAKGTVINVLSTGAVLQFYGKIRGWLPVAEMSDTYIESPKDHFRLGQTVPVRILSVNAELQEMKVSCKDPGLFGAEQQETWDQISGGDLVTGTITQKTLESVTLDLDSGLKGLIRIGHLSDGSLPKAEKALKKLQMGQKLADLVVLHRLERSRHILLTKKSSIVADAKARDLIRSTTDAQPGKKCNGFVRNVTPEGVYIEFAGDIVGLLPKSQIDQELLGQPSFGLIKDQSLSVWVLSINAAREQFTLTMRKPDTAKPASTAQHSIAAALLHPVDRTISDIADLTLGKITKARIASAKSTQINVRLADNVQGRVDVSEVFDSWDDVVNKKHPIQHYQPNQVIDVQILGMHDARSHSFLPISHRIGAVPVFELSAKPSRTQRGDKSGLTLDSVDMDSNHLAFVNNHGDNCVWVNLSPNVRGRIAFMDLSDDLGKLSDLNRNFPIGSALRVNVKSINTAKNRLELNARSGAETEQMTLQNLSPGMIVGAQVTRVTARSIVVQLSDHLHAPVSLVEISDDYDELNLARYQKNSVVRVCIIEIDAPNKKLYLSLRPSRVLSSSLPVHDPQVTCYERLQKGDILRGFVKNVGDKGIYVQLGARVDAFVRVSELSDEYLKDWKSSFEIDQLVKGRIISVDPDAKLCQLSLKASYLADNFKLPLTINDLEPGMIVEGKVRNVEAFGAFIDIDNTKPRLSGLCHKTEVASSSVHDVRKLYSAGDVVKAKILKVDVKKSQISLGLKASYFSAEIEDEDMEDYDDRGVEAHGSEGGVNGDLDGSDINGNQDVLDIGSDVDSVSETADADEADDTNMTGTGLKTSGFEWTGDVVDSNANGLDTESDAEAATPKKKRRSKREIKVDLTGDLDKYGSRSASDFERQLLGQSNDSGLWVQYMAFQLGLSEIQKARDIAERALRTIHIREVEEKANVWIAWMNLEVEYGDDDRVEEVFRRACQVQDPLEMHEKLASIYIDSGKQDKADAIFEKIVGNKAFRPSPQVWLNYATFLMDNFKAPLKARSLLSRALQSVPTNEHRLLTAKFAALEFRSPQGDSERGRTIFEGLVAEWPKWTSGWDMWIDLESSRMSHAQDADVKAEARDKVRALFDRIVSQKMKKRRAQYIFKRWLAFEETEGDAKSAERVKALAKEYVEAQQAKGKDEMEE
jgi:rRNA biogenesis protein RRP5